MIKVNTTSRLPVHLQESYANFVHEIADFSDSIWQAAHMEPTEVVSELHDLHIHLLLNLIKYVSIDDLIELTHKQEKKIGKKLFKIFKKQAKKNRMLRNYEDDLNDSMSLDFEPSDDFTIHRHK